MRKIEKSLPVLADEQLSTVAGGSGLSLSQSPINVGGKQNVNNGSGFAGDGNIFASYSNVATKGGQLDASTNALAFLVGVVPTPTM